MIYLKLFLTFMKIGAFTFGGGYAMLPFIQQEVLKNSWLTQEELIDFIAVSESTPGPFAVNVSTFVGCRTAGLLGGLCATLGVILPSFVIILIIAGAYEKFKGNRVMTGVMSGLKPAVVGLISAAFISTAMSVIGSMSAQAAGMWEYVISGVLFVACLIALFKKVNPIIIIVVSAVVGILH